MRHLGLHPDNYTFIDAASFKTQAGNRASSRSARSLCMILARADKRRDRQALRHQFMFSCLAD
jgi:hypothetical protein